LENIYILAIPTLKNESYSLHLQEGLGGGGGGIHFAKWVIKTLCLSEVGFSCWFIAKLPLLELLEEKMV